MPNINLLKLKINDLKDIFFVDSTQFSNIQSLKVDCSFRFGEFIEIDHYLNCHTEEFAVNFNSIYANAILDEFTTEVCKFRKSKIETKSLQKPITVVIGLCRPQILKKIFQVLSLIPVRQIVILLTDLSDRSFLLSKTLDPKIISENITYGITQSGLAFYPKVKLILDKEESFKYLINSEQKLKILADGNSDNKAVSLLNLTNENKVVLLNKGLHLFIGPERGWSKREKFEIERSGAITIKIDDSVLRVDSALISLSSQISLIYDLFNSSKQGQI
jgi:RsmE family RNA methyltransferase